MTTAIPSVQVAMGDDFLLAFSQLPKSIQKKARAFIEKFRSNPTSTGLNYEKINACSDPNLRSLRVDQDYRAIVLKPRQDNTFILLWIDKHDDAYHWAGRRVCSIHPSTGALQIIADQYDETIPEPPPEAPKAAPEQPELPGLFAAHSDTDLIDLGIPEQSLPRIRTIKTDEDLDKIENNLPSDAFEALFSLALGASVDEVKQELGIEKPALVETDDFAAALQRESAQRKFVVISDSAEMEKILAYPLDRWRTFLHPSQRRIVEMNAKGPVRVLGGAGTGKTVVAIHRAKWLAERICEKNEKVLFTTFTTNLAADIESNLKKICSHDTLQKIEVCNIDAWASRFLSSASNQKRRPDFGGKQLQKLWEDALTLLPTDFPLSPGDVAREWRYVVQGQGIRTETDYIRAPRVGMGAPLARGKRKALWPVFEEYLSLQAESGICEPIDTIRMARELIAAQNTVLDYRAVIIDEAQDFSPEAFRLAQAIVPAVRAERGNQLFIVGDAHQRLYGHKVVLSHCGINIRGRSKRLKINYRTSEETKKWASAILEQCAIDDLDGGIDTLKGYRSLFHGDLPMIEPGESTEQQTQIITDHINNLKSQGTPLESICVVAKSNDLCKSLQSQLEANNFQTKILSKGKGDDTNRPGIRIATMHRVKGIEFDHMILAHMEAKTWIRHQDGESLSTENRCLIYVAATRARKTVLVTSADKICNEIYP